MPWIFPNGSSVQCNASYFSTLPLLVFCRLYQNSYGFFFQHFSLSDRVQNKSNIPISSFYHAAGCSMPKLPRRQGRFTARGSVFPGRTRSDAGDTRPMSGCGWRNISVRSICRCTPPFPSLHRARVSPCMVLPDAGSTRLPSNSGYCCTPVRSTCNSTFPFLLTPLLIRER